MENNLSKIKSSSSLSSIVHDLKTPITSIMGFIELLKEGNYDKNLTTEFYDIILSESQKLLDLVNEILQLNKDHELNSNTSNLNIQINKYVKELTPLAHKRQIEILVSLPPEELWVFVPEEKVSRILINIIENAIKYNKENGKVFINIDKKDNTVFIKIRDTGLGIAETELSKIFSKYYRSTSIKHLPIEGTGLGLSIVKEIVEEYKGKIIVNSKLNEYTEFTIELPLSSLISHS